MADWSLVLAGIRKDITLEPFNSGVISDATGKVIQNLMQEDKMAIRATFRAGYYLATPPTGYTVAEPCPVGVVKNTGTMFVPHGDGRASLPAPAAESEVMPGESDPFGYLDDAARSEAEDREAEALLSAMMADGDSYIRDLLRRKRNLPG